MSHTDPSPLRMLMFDTPEERMESLPETDRLLAVCWSMQHELLDRLPESRERAIAAQKLEEFASYTRFAIMLSHRKD
jgi:hypothetical protein